MGGLARHGVPRHEMECADFVHGHDDLPWIPLGQHLHHVRHTLTSRLRLQIVLVWRGPFLDVFRYLLGDGACDQPSDDVADYDAAKCIRPACEKMSPVKIGTLPERSWALGEPSRQNCRRFPCRGWSRPHHNVFNGHADLLRRHDVLNAHSCRTTQDPTRNAFHEL